MEKKIVWAIAVLVLAVGMVLSVRDYRVWHAQEIGKFGQGTVASEELAPAKLLALPYVAYVGNFRIKPPTGWNIIENSALKNMRPAPVLSKVDSEIVRFKDPNSAAQIVITARHVVADASALINAQAVGVTRDRGYITAGGTTITILTWDMPNEVLQKAVVYSSEDFIIISASSSVSAWKTWANTFASVYQTWTPI